MSKQNIPEDWMKIIAKCWADEDFKKRLLENPSAVLAEECEDFPFSDNIKINVLENSENTINLVLPAEPTGHDTLEVEERLSAGVFW